MKYLADELVGNQIDEVLGYGDLEDRSLKEKYPEITFMGYIPREKIPDVYKNGIYISLDVNAACPNTVIESLASGIPVVGFDTGALKELVSDNCGEVVDYGSDPWKLARPDNAALKSGIEKVIKNFNYYSKNARILAEEKYSLESLVEKYIEILEQ